MSTLFVDSIEPKTTGGVVTMPDKPAWGVKHSTGAYINTTPLVFNLADVNRGNIYNTSTGVVTIPQTGVYFVSFMLYCRIDPAAEDVSANIEKSIDNGLTFSRQTYAYAYPVDSRAHITINNNIMLPLNKNDQLRCAISGNGDYYSGMEETRFSGFLI